MGSIVALWLALGSPGLAGESALEQAGQALGYILTSAPGLRQQENLLRALNLLERTATGRAILRDVGIFDTQRLGSERALLAVGIDLRVGDIPEWACATPQSWLRPGWRWQVILDKDVVGADPADLAPLLAHELAHVRDLRHAKDREESLAPSERRAYLLMARVAVELEEQGAAQPPRPQRLAHLRLRLWERFLANVWSGRPVGPADFDRGLRRDVRALNREISKAPGLSALLAYADFRRKVGRGIPRWESAGSGASVRVREFDAALLAEDLRFRASRAARRGGFGAAPIPAPEVLPPLVHPWPVAASPVLPPQVSVPPVAAEPPQDPEAAPGFFSRFWRTVAQSVCAGRRFRREEIAGMSRRWVNRQDEAERERLAGLRDEEPDACARGVLRRIGEARGAAFTQDDLVSWAQATREAAPPPRRGPGYDHCIDPGQTCFR